MRQKGPICRQMCFTWRWLRALSVDADNNYFEKGDVQSARALYSKQQEYDGAEENPDVQQMAFGAVQL